MRQEQMRKSLCRQAGKELQRLERQLRFYSCILSYFQNWEEPVPAGCLPALLNEPEPVASLWSLYQKSGTLDYTSGEKIRELLEDFFYYKEICVAA